MLMMLFGLNKINLQWCSLMCASWAGVVSFGNLMNIKQIDGRERKSAVNRLKYLAAINRMISVVKF